MSGKLDLQRLHQKILRCKKCRLCKNRIHAVPGEGPFNAKIMFIGEAPGAEEDKTGRPFVGRSGRLLTQLLSEARLKRKEVFITSVVKSRPPKNRNPKADELKACRFWWMEQVVIIKPKIIVLLGLIAKKEVLAQFGIKAERGQFVRYQNMDVMWTYHPAAALRSTRWKKTLLSDLKKIAKKMRNMK